VSSRSGSWGPVILPSDGQQIDITLKDGELFMVGDNRIDSIDSRYYGPIKVDEIIGRVPYSVDHTKRPFDSFN